jgi:hypothetical protein
VRLPGGNDALFFRGAGEVESVKKKPGGKDDGQYPKNIAADKVDHFSMLLVRIRRLAMRLILF